MIDRHGNHVSPRDIFCPKCGSNDGYYQRGIISRYTQYYDFSGEPVEASENMYISGGKRRYCNNCSRDITAFVEKLLSTHEE